MAVAAGVVLDLEDAEASLRDVLAAALEANQEQAMAPEWVQVRLHRQGRVVVKWYNVIADPQDIEDMRELGAHALRSDPDWEERDASASTRWKCEGPAPAST